MFIESACILHNVILQHEENEEEDDHIDNAEEVPEEWCEDELAHRTTDSQAQCSSAERNRAKQKRDEIMNNSDVKVFLVLCVIKNAIRIKSKCYLISN